mgnify:CR=1 FL=1
MATATSNVQLTVTYKGIDQTTKAGRSARRTLRRYGSEAEKVGDQAAAQSGRLSTALSSLGDFAGQSEGAFRTASEAAGAFDDVLTLLPGPIGITVGALAGLTTVMILQRQESERLRNKLAQTFSGQTLTDVYQLAGGFDLTADASIALGNAMDETGKTANDLRERVRAIVARADELGEDSTQAVIAFAKSLSASIGPATKLANQLKAQAIAARQVSFAEIARGTALEGEVKDADNAALARLKELKKELGELKQREQDLARGRVGEFKALRERTEWYQRLATGLGLNSAQHQRAVDAAQADREEQARLGRQIAKVTEEIENFAHTREQALKTVEAAARAEEKIRKQEADAELAAAEASHKALLAKEAEIKATERARKLRQRAAKESAAASRIEREDASRRAAQISLLDRQAADLDRKKEAAAKAAADAQKANFTGAIQQATALQSTIGGTDSAVTDLMTALPALSAGVATALGKSETKMQDALAIGQTAILGLVDADSQRAIASARNEDERAKAVEAAERKKAGVLAIMAAAQAAVAFASGNLPGAASAAAAAALYAGVAGGAIRKSGAGAGVASVGATTGGGQTLTTTAADAAPSAGAVNINFGSGFIFGTKQQVGRAVAGSIKSLRTTGLAAAGGV